MASSGRRQSQDLHASPVTASYPFPHIDASSRKQSSQRPIPRRDSTASSVLSSGTAQNGYNPIVESDPNAISTLLSPPIIRTGLQPHSAPVGSGYRAPTQRDIPPVALTNIRHVEAKTFHPYLAQVSSLYEAFQRAKNEIDGGEASLFQRDKRQKSEDWEALLSRKLQRPPHSRQNSVSTSSVTSPTETPRPKRRPSAQQRTQSVTPLSTIPIVYSDEDFHLENPRTFDVVSERSEIVRDPNATTPSGRKPLATNALLQEKLSWYMDTVEVHLISSISTASKSFFSALGELRELHAEAEDSVTRIQRLRKELARLDKEMAVDGLKVVNLKQRRDNVKLLASAILQLQDTVNAVKRCEEMVKEGELDAALEDIDQAEHLMAGEIVSDDYVSRDLRNIKALDGALDDLNALRGQVGRGYESRFHTTLLGDMRKHVSETEPSTTLQRWGVAFVRPKAGQRRAQSTVASYMNMEPGFREELENEIRGLSKAKFTTQAVTSFRSLVLREMKSMIRRQLPSTNDDDAMSTMSASTFGGRRTQQEKSSMLARNLRALDDGDWYQMLVKVYTNISESLRRLSIQVKILLDVTSAMDHPQSAGGMKSPPPPSADLSDNLSPSSDRARLNRNRSVSIQAEMQQALDLSNLLGEAVDAAHSQLSKVLKVRSPQISDMSLQDFIAYFTLNKLFANECEAISGRSGTNLKTILDIQIKEYVTQFGNRQRQSLVEALDADRWNARDFGEDQNAILSRVIEGSTNDASAWTESTMIWQARSAQSMPTTTTNGTTATAAVNTANGTATAAPVRVKSAVVDEQRYILSESPIAMLQSLEQFQHLAIGIPTMGQELVNSLIETLKIFNSRTNQLILGAGATKSAGLQNITTKHLALSSQGLSFMVALIPYIREFFRRYIPPSTSGQSMIEFDKVKRLFQDHQSGIHEKLVDIMSNRAALHVRAMKAIDWDNASTGAPNNTQVQGQQASPYMETLTKETATLQKVLKKHLSEDSVMSIMAPVFDSYRKQWESAYTEVKLKTPQAKNRMLVDVLIFDARIGKLDGAGDLGAHLVRVVEAKPIEGSAPLTTTTNTDDTRGGSSSDDEGDAKNEGNDDSPSGKDTIAANEEQKPL